MKKLGPQSTVKDNTEGVNRCDDIDIKQNPQNEIG